MNSEKRFIWLIVLTAVLLSNLTLAGVSFAAEKFPSREIIFINNFAPGGASDLTARVVAEYLQKVVGVPVVVDNRPEGGNVKGVIDVYRAKPDGYTLLASPFHVNAINEIVHKAPYKLLDLTYLAACSKDYNPVSVNKDSPYRTLKDLIDASKRKSLNCGISGLGTTSCYLAMFLKKEVGVNLETIPFKGSHLAMLALLGGNVDIVTLEETAVLRQIEKIRPLAILSEERSLKLPDVPTFKELGYDIPILCGIVGIAGPPGLPEGIKEILSDALAKAAKNPEFIRKADGMGLRPIYLSGPEFRTKFEFIYKLMEKNRDIFMEKK